MAGSVAANLSPTFRRLHITNRSPKTRLPPPLFLSTMVSSESIVDGSSGADGIRLPLFGVKQLSLHSAGCDLSRYRKVFTFDSFAPFWMKPIEHHIAFHSRYSEAAVVVPARGKALLPIDLSITIPDGTYPRIGMECSRGSFTCR